MRTSGFCIFFSIYSSFNTNLTGNETAFNQLIDPFVILSQRLYRSGWGFINRLDYIDNKDRES